MLDSLPKNPLSSSLLDASHSLHARSFNVPFSEQIFLKHAAVWGTCCLFAYDYLCTLDREVAYVWSRRRTFGTYLFALNRYLPFIDLLLSLTALEVILSPEGCHRQYSLITWFNTLGITISQTILNLRTIAIWERNRWIMAILGVVYFSTLATSITTLKILLNSMQFAPADPANYFGCILVPSELVLDSLVSISFGAVFVSETTIVTLTMIRAAKHLRRSTSSWVHQLYKRGFLFYVYLLVLTTLNMVFPIFAPLALKTVFSDLQRALHSMLCNRVVFIIMSLQQEQEEDLVDTCDIGLYRRTRGEDDNAMALSTILDTFLTRDER